MKKRAAYLLIPWAAAGLLAGRLWQPRLAEDAYIALRYSANLANGQGLVYNPGDRPVEGATSFLNTVLVAGAIRLGSAPEIAAQMVAIAALLGACALLAGLLPTNEVDARAALAAAIALAISPLAALAVFGFDTALAVCFSTLVAVLLHRLLLSVRRAPDSPIPEAKHTLALPIACLLLCLARPDAVFLALPALLAAGMSVPHRKTFLRDGLLGFALPGLLFFLWRWRYFGYPFPNAFYVKHEGAWFHRETLAAGIKSIVAVSASALLLIAAWLIAEPRARRLGMKLCVPWLVFLAAFTLINNEQNAYGRFQLPALPWILSTAALAWTDLARHFPRRETAATPVRHRPAGGVMLAVLVVMAVFPLFLLRYSDLFRYRALTASTYAAGRALAPFADRAYAGKTYGLMVSEAGVLPFYARWRTLDAHGLNDPEVAHHGLTTAYVDGFRPDVVEFHVGAPDYRPDRPWLANPVFERMTKWMVRYCLQRGYRRVAVCRLTALSHSYDWYFVNPRCPDAAVLAQRLVTLPGVSYVHNEGNGGAAQQETQDALTKLAAKRAARLISSPENAFHARTLHRRHP